jgi:hypothetical protein
MSVKKAFSYGALAGSGLAILLLLLTWIRPFSLALNGALEKATFWLCPFYVLMFMNIFRTNSEVILATILGNAILYGLLGVLLSLAFRLIRSNLRSVPR